MKTRSLMGNVAKRFLILLFLLLTMLICIYLYSVNIVKNNLIESSKSEVELYKKDIDDKLKRVSGSLDEVLYLSDTLSSLGSMSVRDIYYSSRKLLDVLENKIIYNGDADAFFVVNNSSEVILLCNGNNVTTKQNVELNQFLRSDIFQEKKIENNVWSLQRIGDSSAFVKTYMFSDTYVGAVLLDTSALSIINRKLLNDSNGYILTDGNGECFSVIEAGQNVDFDNMNYLENDEQVVEDRNKNVILITGQFEQSSARLTAFIKQSFVWNSFTYIQYGIIILVAGAILFLIYIFYFFQKKIVYPILQLVDATRYISAGDWEISVETNSPMKELNVLENSFNMMISEIKNLKIQSYEEKMERQKTELRYLQMQIKPHFYLNALTTIHSMAYKNKGKEIQEFVEALSSHMRYIIRDGLSLVKLSEELEHVSGYIRMQEIRYPDRVFFMADIAESLKEILIPQFLILTFVENSFKYAMDMEKVLFVLVCVNLEKKNGHECIHIKIEDNGKGYPQSVIDNINGETQEDPGKEHGIGILNIKKTLQLFYKEKVQMNLSNTIPSGACVNLWLEADEGNDENSNC